MKVAQKIVVVREKPGIDNANLQTPEFSDPEDNFCVSPGKLPTDRLASERELSFAQLRSEMIDIEDQL